MSSRLNALSLAGALALAYLVATPAKADESNKRIEFKFSAPVQIPGNVLQPGKYVFELVDQADRDAVKVSSEDANGRERLIAIIQTIRTQAANTPDKPVVHFEERPSGTLEAIHSWYYPGESTGWEFLYPKGARL